MPYTKVQIISFALAKLGSKPIASLDNQSDIVSAAEAAFDFLFPLSISEMKWNFSIKIAQVSQLVTEPIIDDWQYIYQLPADYLKMIRQSPHNFQYKIFNQYHMYSNMPGPLYIIYQFQPLIATLPAYFCNYLAARIAEHLALSNAHNAQFATKLKADLQFAMSSALATDSQNQPQDAAIENMPIIRCRNASSFSNRGYGFGYGF